MAENKGFSSTEISNILKEVQKHERIIRENGTTTAEVTMINARGILLFVGGKEYYLSYDRYPWFRNAKVSDVLDVTMPDEESLRWDAIDVDLEIDSIIHQDVTRYLLTNKALLTSQSAGLSYYQTNQNLSL